DLSKTIDFGKVTGKIAFMQLIMVLIGFLACLIMTLLYIFVFDPSRENFFRWIVTISLICLTTFVMVKFVVPTVYTVNTRELSHELYHIKKDGAIKINSTRDLLKFDEVIATKVADKKQYIPREQRYTVTTNNGDNLLVMGTSREADQVIKKYMEDKK